MVSWLLQAEWNFITGLPSREYVNSLSLGRRTKLLFTKPKDIQTWFSRYLKSIPLLRIACTPSLRAIFRNLRKSILWRDLHCTLRGIIRLFIGFKLASTRLLHGLRAVVHTRFWLQPKFRSRASSATHVRKQRTSDKLWNKYEQGHIYSIKESWGSHWTWSWRPTQNDLVTQFWIAT